MTDRLQPPPGTVVVARLGRSHGLEGAVRVHPRDEPALAALAAVDQVWVEGLGQARVLGLKAHGSHWLLRLDRLRRVELAKELVHAAVRLDPARLPADIAGALGRDATGLPVFVDGRRYGEVVAMEGTPLQPLVRVRGPAGERLLPLSAHYVAFDDEAVRVTDPPAGLLDE